jgi:single-strand DNA-binding protein
MYGNSTTVVGNATRDPELRFTPKGNSVCNLSVAVNEKGRDGQEDRVHFFDVVCWGDLAQNVGATVAKGMRVVVTGKLQQRTWEQDGSKRTKVEILADEVAPSLRWATAQVVRQEPSGAAPSRPKSPEYSEDEEPF